MQIQNNAPQMLTMAGNLASMANQLQEAARSQFAREFDADIQGSSRGLLLAEIGLKMQEIKHALATVNTNLDMLQELPIVFDESNKPTIVQIF